MLLLLRHCIKFSQQQPVFYHPQLLFLNNRKIFCDSCYSPVFARSQSSPIFTVLPSIVVRSIQTASRRKPRLPCSIDLKCDLLRQERFSPSQVTVLQDNPYFRSVPFEKVLSVISFLRSKGIEGALAGKVFVRTPCMLHYKVEGIERKCKFLEDLGMGELGLQRLLTKMRSRFVLGLSTEGLQKHIDFLQRIGLEKRHILKMITEFSNVLFLNIERKMEPAVAFFERQGMSKEVICKLVRLRPQVFCYSLDRSLTEKLEFVRRLGLSTDSKNGARAFRYWISLNPKVLLSKWEGLSQQGFSDPDILKMVKQHPEILVTSKDSVKRKIDYFKNVLNRDVHELTKYPAFTNRSLENRIIPRFTFLNELKEKGERAKRFSLSTLLASSDEAFERKHGPGYGEWKTRYFSEKVA